MVSLVVLRVDDVSIGPLALEDPAITPTILSLPMLHSILVLSLIGFQ